MSVWSCACHCGCDLVGVVMAHHCGSKHVNVVMACHCGSEHVGVHGMSLW